MYVKDAKCRILRKKNAFNRKHTDNFVIHDLLDILTWLNRQKKTTWKQIVESSVYMKTIIVLHTVLTQLMPVRVYLLTQQMWFQNRHSRFRLWWTLKGS